MSEPAAWIIHDIEDEYYGRGPDTVRFCPLLPEEEEAGVTATPLVSCPQPHPSQWRGGDMRYVLIPLVCVVFGSVVMAGFVAVCAGLAYLFVAYAGLSQADANVATQISLFIVIMAVVGLAIACDKEGTP